MATSSQARRRRNAILAAVLLALIFIVIVVLIIVGVSGKGNKGNKPTEPPVTTTPAAVLPTIPTITEEPTADPNATFDPTATEDPLNSSLPTLDPTVTGAVTTPTPTAPQEAGTVMYVTGDGVNVRKAATTESDKIASLSKGTAVTAYNKVGDFYSVKLSDGKLGYISAKFVSVNDPKKAEITPTAKPTATPDTSKGVTKYVNADKVNVRASGSSSATKLTSLVKGKEVIAYATVGDWTYIRYGTSKYGYISTKYLSDTAPSSATATATAAPTATATAKPTAAPTPTAAPKKSFTDYNVPAAVANIADRNTDYLNDAGSYAGRGSEVVDGTTINYYKINTKDNIEINGKTFFYIWYEGSNTEPSNVQFKSVAPTA